MAEYESGPQTINRVLSSYEFGRKLRGLRLKKKIALTELGKHTGLSASMLSQLENGKLIPTLPTLARIAMVFDVGLEYFFGNRRKDGLFEVVRNEERMRFPSEPDKATPNFFFEVLAYKANNKPIEAYMAEFPELSPESVTQHVHNGTEFIHILSGSLEVVYQEEATILQAGDSAFFDSSEPHSYRGISSPAAKAFVITASFLR